MKTIGMIVAVELQSVLKRYGAKLVKRKETAGYQVLEYETDQYRMVIVNCGRNCGSIRNAVSDQ